MRTGDAPGRKIGQGKMDILPAIDIRDGQCVRLLQGDYAKEIHYAHDPVAVAKQFEQAGANWVHVVDLDGAREGKPNNLKSIERIIKETGLKVEVGGGVRTSETILSLLGVGAARCVVGTRALEDWDWFEQVVHRSECENRIAIGLDSREGKLAVRGWTAEVRETALQVAEKVADWPLAAIIYTDIGRDGMLLGPNLDSIKALAEYSQIPVIASGGVTDIDDVQSLARMPILGIIIGRAIYEKQLELKDAIAIAARAS
ncbi:MAG: 1-(5-phosphoribosyl)-5-[(5-phosphoribosylamino)methylideneamino]imidazole-4-carboxamide isomerase [Planctomycetaceae bacterium]|nr:1-(5-phosphoribosyl)-5-[(5-phosphoribosylamino)methylideneamino]imidazole-4-carboxamide isomerase [Planctomycetaceae bacterium]